MGNVTVAEELAGSEELDELRKLDASESAPEEDDGEDEEEDGEEDGEGDGGEEFEPSDIPHG
jgi:hypothetical protein